MNDTDKLKFLITEFDKSVREERYKYALLLLEQMRRFSDKPGMVIPVEAYAAMGDELRMICFDSMLGVMFRVITTSMQNLSEPAVDRPFKL